MSSKRASGNRRVTRALTPDPEQREELKDPLNAPFVSLAESVIQRAISDLGYTHTVTLNMADTTIIVERKRLHLWFFSESEEINSFAWWASIAGLSHESILESLLKRDLIRREDLH